MSRIVIVCDGARDGGDVVAVCREAGACCECVESISELDRLAAEGHPCLVIWFANTLISKGGDAFGKVARAHLCSSVVLYRAGEELIALDAMRHGAFDCLPFPGNDPGSLLQFVCKALKKIELRKEQCEQGISLLESEQRFRSLVENIPGVVLQRELEGRGRVLFISNGIERLAGRVVGDFCGSGAMEWFDIVVAEDVERLTEELAVALGRGNSYVLEYRIVTADGRQRNIVEKGSFSRDASQRAIWVDAVLTDVTDQRSAEKAMQSSEERLRLAMDATSDGPWDWDLGTDSIYWGARAYTMLGYRPSEFSVNFETWQALVHSEDLEQMGHSLWAGLNDSGHFNIEYRLRTQAGKYRWINSRGKVVERDHLGRVLRVVGTHVDISDRIDAERKLLESNRWMHTLFEEANDAIFVADAESGIILSANAKASKLLGRPVSEIVGAHQTTLHPVEDVEKYSAMFRAAVQKNTPIPSGSLELVNKQGQRIPVDASVSSIQLPNGRRVLQGIFRDVSERVQLELELRQAQKMEAIGRLAGGVAHDFNNVLAAIMLQMSMLQSDRRLPSDVHSTLTLLESSTKRAADLTRQLLFFGRRQPVKVQSIDVDVLISNFLKMLRRLIGENIRLEFFPRTGLHWVSADVGMIEQVIMNMVVNSRDAMPNGGRILIETGLVDRKAQSVQGERADYNDGSRSYVVISVRDDGTGMDDSTLRRIFEPFFTTKPQGKGTGLGLATAYSIIKQHHGLIEADSEIGKGSCFRIFLPRVEPVYPKASPPATIAENKGGKGVVLLVEDDNIVRTFTNLSLRAGGYSVVEARDGVDAIKAWDSRAGGIDLLLTDMVMPNGINGAELIQRFRAIKPDLGVVLMSGYSAAVPKSVQEQGTKVVFLQKPFDSIKLNQALMAAQMGMGTSKKGE